MRQIPALGIAAARFRVLAEIGHTPETYAEVVLETLLTQLAAAVQPGQPAPTKASLADLVEASARIAHEKVEAQPVHAECGHRWSEHVGRVGCFACDCTEVRPDRGAVGPVVQRVGEEVTVISPRSPHRRQVGLAIARDGEGLMVQLAASGKRIPVEMSDVEPRPRAPLANYNATTTAKRVS